MKTKEKQCEVLNKPKEYLDHIDNMQQKMKPKAHTQVLEELIELLQPIDFEERVFQKRSEWDEGDKSAENEEQSDDPDIGTYKLRQKHYLVESIECILEKAQEQNWGFCKHQEFMYVYNGEFWEYIDEKELQSFLGKAAEKLGVPIYEARFYEFREKLLKQFASIAYLPSVKINKNSVRINLKNGTYEIKPRSKNLQQFEAADFMTYQLPFRYDNKAKATEFQKYLDRVLPDKSCQKVLAEYIGSLFIKHQSGFIKHEKALILYGTGANGKSVFFEIINALLGNENVSNYSLQSLTDTSGYYRMMIGKKLVNYASEINQKMETSIFKQLVSGEPIEARAPFSKPIILKEYAKLIFNCNELPKDVESTHAFFRRFLIIPFEVTIPEHEQDKELHLRIIENELSGVFNWVLEGLDRLIQQKGFTPCKAAQNALEQYQLQSDSVKQFLEEKNYISSSSEYVIMKSLYSDYREFCREDGFHPLNKSNFTKRLKGHKISIERKNVGNVAYLFSKPNEESPF